MVTQAEIARRAGVDVSSANKILNRSRGPVFAKETVDRVFRIARELGYDFNRMRKGWMTAELTGLFPREVGPAELAKLYRLPVQRVKEIKRKLYGEVA